MRKPTPAQAEVLALMAQGGVLVMRSAAEDQGPYLMQGTCEVRSVNLRIFRSLRKRGAIKPAGDGMFGTTQTYVLSEAAQ